MKPKSYKTISTKSDWLPFPEHRQGKKGGFWNGRNCHEIKMKFLHKRILKFHFGFKTVQENPKYSI